MVNEAKKIFLAGVGIAAMTYEKSSHMISQLVEKGKITVEEGKELSEELKRDVKSNADCTKEVIYKKIDSIKPITREELDDIFTEMNFATKIEISILLTRIESLEKRIEELEEKAKNQ